MTWSIMIFLSVEKSKTLWWTTKPQQFFSRSPRMQPDRPHKPVGLQRWLERAAGPSLQVWRALLPKREGWEPREESLQLLQLLSTCFFYGHLQVFGIIPVVAVGTTVDSGAFSRPLAFTAKVQMLCLFEAHLAGRLLDGLPEGAVTDVPSSIEPSQQANQ